METTKKEFKGTNGKWYVKHGHVYCDGGVIALGGTVRTVDETRRDGEPWLSMMERVKPERESIKKEREANVKLIAQSLVLLNELQSCQLIIETMLEHNIGRGRVLGKSFLKRQWERNESAISSALEG